MKGMSQGKGRDKYRGVNLPRELMEDVDKVVGLKRFGFKTPAEFVRAATRDKVKEYLQLIEEEEDVV